MFQWNLTMKTCEKPLKSNPFTTYRDPKTGQWIVIRHQSSSPSSSEKIA
ncbi:MAG: hypothetical protein SWJ54_16740 [Cyanobacteriota bacterium]|nr:hypothetical protein [Cyanobacteriota bacterium]